MKKQLLFIVFCFSLSIQASGLIENRNNPPTAQCKNSTVILRTDGTASITPEDIDDGSFDLEGPITLSLDISTFTCLDIGTNTVVLTVTDTDGNTAFCSAEVTVADTTAPNIICPNSMTVEAESGTCGAVVYFNDAVSIDSCNGIIATIQTAGLSTGSFFPLGDTVITFTATDDFGNAASCSFTVSVVDMLEPVIDCPANQTVDTDAGSVTYTVPDYFGEGLVTVTDNCTDPITLYSQSPAAGSLLLDGTYTITLTATDAFDNTSTCEFELIVDDPLSVRNSILDFNSLTIYPNPATLSITISNPKNIEIDKIAVYDIHGRMVLSLNTKGQTGNHTLDVSSLSSAVYMVSIESNGKQTFKRLIRK